MPDEEYINPSNNQQPNPMQSGQSSDTETANDDNASIAQGSQPTPPQQIPTQPSHRRSPSGILVAMVILLVVIGAAAAIYIMRSNQTSSVDKKDIPLLRYGLNTGNLAQIYPSIPNTDTATALNSQIFEGLVKYQNPTSITTDLATSWQNPDSTTWIFNLRHNVTFHDGRTMTAADVKASLDYAVAHQNDQNSAELAIASTISKVEAVNPYEVKIITNGPDPVLLNRLTFLYVYDSHGKVGDPQSGTGPYVVKPGTTPKPSKIYLAAYDKYWGGHVYTRELDISVMSSDQLATSILHNQMDFAGDFNASQLKKLAGGGRQEFVIPNIGVEFIGLNTLKTGSPLNSLTVRKAMEYALDTKAILKADGVQGTTADQLVPQSIPGYNPSIQPVPYDPAKAEQMLASVPNLNLKTPLTLSYLSSDTLATINTIASELKAVGFNVQLNQLASINDLVSVGLSGQTDMFFLSYSTNTLDGNDIFANVIQNPSIYNNSQINNLIDQANQIIDPTTRLKALQQISQLVANDIPDIPLYIQNYVYILTKPYYIQQNQATGGAGTDFWKVYQK